MTPSLPPSPQTVQRDIFPDPPTSKPSFTQFLNESRGTSVFEATQNRISIVSRARPRSLVVTCRATELRVMSYRIMCRVMSYRAMLCHVMLFRVCRVVSCRRAVLPCRVVSMWWSPTGVCAQAFFCQRIMSVTQPRPVIRLRTAHPPHIFSSSRC